jgi:uncharacterized membrane protein YbhN (UPF0104 family)
VAAMSSRFRRLLLNAGQLLIALFVVALAIAALRENWDQFRAQEIEWRFAPGWLVLSVAAVLTSYAVLVWAWRSVVVSQGQRLPYWEAARIWALASLGKYLPGKVWSVAGAWVLAQRAGVDPSVAVLSALVLQALAVASGVMVGTVPIVRLLSGEGPWLPLAAGAAGVIALAGLWGLSSERVVAAVRRLAPGRLAALRALRKGTLAVALGANLVAWLGYGLALWLLARSILPDLALGFARAVGAFAAAYTVGFVMLIAPGGVGPRESVFVLLTMPIVGPKAALALAVASRLQLTALELGVALPFLRRRARE